MTSQLGSLGFETGLAVDSSRPPQPTSLIQTTPEAQCLAIQLAVLLGIDRIDVVGADAFAIDSSQGVAPDVALILGDDIANEGWGVQLGDIADATTARGDARCDR